MLLPTQLRVVLLCGRGLSAATLLLGQRETNLFLGKLTSHLRHLLRSMLHLALLPFQFLFLLEHLLQGEAS